MKTAANTWVEIRRNAAGTDFECDWGTFENANANPNRSCGIKHLVLVTHNVFQRMIDSGPERNVYQPEALMSASIHKERKFVHLDHHDVRYTWELFDACWWDDGGPEIYVGKWPD